MFNTKVLRNLQFLDNIMTIILDYSGSYPLEYNTLIKKLNEIESKDTFFKRCIWLKSKLFDKIYYDELADEFYHNLPKLNNALLYLHNEGLIVFNEQELTALITFKGIVKISAGGYVKEYRSQIWSKMLQNATLIISIISFLAGVYFKKYFI